MRLNDGKFGSFSVRLDLRTSHTFRKRIRGDRGLPITENRCTLIFSRRDLEKVDELGWKR
jgi:hypothetical protein